jgi:glycosyltransferase involved in cell wall biosynthesis
MRVAKKASHVAASSHWIAYVGPFTFPWGQPGSRRVYGIARALAGAGYQVTVASGDATPAEAQLLERDGPGTIRHVGLSEVHRPDAPLAEKVLKMFVLQGRNTVRWLEAQPRTPSHVVVYGGDAPLMARMLPWCRRRGVALVADVVEWYDPRQLAGGRFGPYHASTKLALRWQYPRCDGVIAISSYLENYYRDRGVLAIRVPPTLDVDAVPPPERGPGEASTPLTLLYAGTPGRKDLLVNVIDGVARVDPRGDRVRLRVLGPTHLEIARLLGRGAVPGFVEAVGRVPQTEVLRAYGDADFSVLLRESLRFTNAGFPTKVAESLATGTPVICNLTSDLGEYVHDGVEGVVSADHTAREFAHALRRALSLSASARREMRVAARRTAERSFDYRRYSERLSVFLERIRRHGSASSA